MGISKTLVLLVLFATVLALSTALDSKEPKENTHAGGVEEESKFHPFRPRFKGRPPVDAKSEEKANPEAKGANPEVKAGLYGGYGGYGHGGYGGYGHGGGGYGHGGYGHGGGGHGGGGCC